MPMDDILQVNERLRGLIWGAPMLILLLGTGLYFTAVTGVFQVRYCALWLRKTLFSCFTGAARRTSGGVSPFAAMCTALAATVGTGNRADARRSGSGALAVGERLCRHDDGFCGEHARDALPRAGSGRQLARRSHAVSEKRSAQSAIGGSLCAVLCAGIVRYRQHEPVQLNRAGTCRLVRNTERDRRRGDSGFARRGASRRPQTAVPRDGNTRAIHGAVLHGRRGHCAVGASSESAAGVRADLFDGVRYKGRHGRRARLRHDAGCPGGCVARHIFK